MLLIHLNAGDHSRANTDSHSCMEFSNVVLLQQTERELHANVYKHTVYANISMYLCLHVIKCCHALPAFSQGKPNSNFKPS